MKVRRWIKGIGAAGCLVLVLIVSHGTRAQNAAPGGSSHASGPAFLTPGVQLLLSRLQVGATLDDYLRLLRFEFVQLDADANGKLNQTDIDLHEAIEATPFRVSAINTIMSFDLDGDNVVTEDEIRIVMRYNARATLAAAANPGTNNAQGVVSALRQVENSVRTVMERDTDKDGKLTYAEISKSVGPSLQRGGNHNWSARLKQVQTLNSDLGGEVTLTSFLSAAEVLFRAVDTDSDGKMSQQEIVDYWRAPTASDAAQAKAVQSTLTRAQQAEADRQKDRFMEPARPGCAMPQPSPQAKILLLSSYRPEALSSVSIGDPSIVVHAGRVVVEPGDEPLYVVIPASATTIWQFSGAVGRIERLVMNSPANGLNRADQDAPPAVGATGLPQDRIAFLGKPDCVTHFFELPSLQSSQAVAAVRQATGQEPFKAFAAYSVMGFNIPSGKIDSLADRRRQMLTIEKGAGTLRVDGDTSNLLMRAAPSKALNDLYNNLPGGLIEIDPKSVISSFPAQTYEVFPQQAGLVQLLESGALKQNRTGEYIVQKKMRFPAGLFGLSVKFLVPHGIPVPDGDPGHSCVIVEDGAANNFDLCRS